MEGHLWFALVYYTYFIGVFFFTKAQIQKDGNAVTQAPTKTAGAQAHGHKTHINTQAQLHGEIKNSYKHTHTHTLATLNQPHNLIQFHFDFHSFPFKIHSFQCNIYSFHFDFQATHTRKKTEIPLDETISSPPFHFISFYFCFRECSGVLRVRV